MSDPLGALRAAAAPGPRAPAADARVALVAGAVGRLGEAVLNRVLGSGHYVRVVALARAPMALGIQSLSLASADALPAIDEVFLVRGQSDDPAGRSFYGRDAAFEAVDDGNCVSIARAAHAAGARRLVVVTPTPLWQQIGGWHAGLSGDEELAIAALDWACLTLLRPIGTGGTRARHWVERIAAIYTSLQMFALPRSMSVLPSEQVARCALAAMRLPGDGVRVLGAERLQALLDPVGAGSAQTPTEARR